MGTTDLLMVDCLQLHRKQPCYEVKTHDEGPFVGAGGGAFCRFGKYIDIRPDEVTVRHDFEDKTNSE